MNRTPTLEEWTERFAPELKANFDVTVDQMTDCTPEERDRLVRLLMIFVRDWTMT
jgi:hypothetical protein